MKLGLDFHGVITDNTDYFRKLAELFIAGGGEVHLITGARRERFDFECKELGIIDFPFTHFFSVCDHHIEKGTDVNMADPDFPKMDADLWDRTKAEYCKENNIGMMIDNTSAYGKCFTTPFFLYKEKTNEALFDYENIKHLRKRIT